MFYNNIPWKYRIGTLVLAGAITYPSLIMAKYPSWHNKKPRPERTVIVTRAASEFGKATAYHFAVRKCRVILGCENLDECRAIRRQMIVDSNNRSLVCRQLDLEDIDSINKFVDEVCESEPHIDVLVNNTNYLGRDKRKMTKYGLEKHFFQNFLGPYLLTLRLLPKLEESAEHQSNSRIVMHVEKPKKGWKIHFDDINFEKRSYTNDKAYEQSQLATAYFAIMLNKKLRDQRSKICVFGQGCKARNHLPIFDQSDSSTLDYFTNYFTPSPITPTHLSVKLGLDDKFNLRDSGKMFTYIFKSWGSNNGWGRISVDDPTATLAWNYAAHLLVNLPGSGDKVSENIEPMPDNSKKEKESQNERQ